MGTRLSGHLNACFLPFELDSEIAQHHGTVLYIHYLSHWKPGQLCFCAPVLLGVSQLFVKTQHQVYSELLRCGILTPACELSLWLSPLRDYKDRCTHGEWGQLQKQSVVFVNIYLFSPVQYFSNIAKIKPNLYMSFLFIDRQFGCGRVQIIVPVKKKTIKRLTVK